MPYSKVESNVPQFQDKYVTRKAQGGEALADELNIRIREYLRELFEDADSLDIIVRVYANLEGMANYLVRLDKVRNLGQLRAFSTGFCGRITSFDWIDTGVGKEGGAGRKVRGTLPYRQSEGHGHHLLLTLRHREPSILCYQHPSPPRNSSLLTRRPPCLAPHLHTPRKIDSYRIPPLPCQHHDASHQARQISLALPSAPAPKGCQAQPRTRPQRQRH